MDISNEPPSLSPDDDDKDEEPAATLDNEPPYAVIPSYELKKNDPAKKGKERCVECSITRGVNVFYDMIHLNMDYATREFKCLNCFKPVEIVFNDDFFKCNLCKEIAVGPCHNFCNTNKQYCVYHIHCENHTDDDNNTNASSGLLADITSTPTKGNMQLVVV